MIELLGEGDHILVNINSARLLEAGHKVLRAGGFPCRADHKLGHISVAQAEDVMETVVHPLLQIGHVGLCGGTTAR